MIVYCSKCNQKELRVPDDLSDELLVRLRCVECTIIEQESRDFDNEGSIRNEETAQYLFPDPDTDPRTREGDCTVVESFDDIGS